MAKTLTSLLLTMVAIGFGPGTTSAVVITQELPSLAIVTSFTSQSSFQAQLTGGFTLVNLDAAPFSGFPDGYRLDDANPATALAARGLDSVGFNAQVFDQQAGQISTPGRDRLIFNGTGFGGLIAFNFSSPVNGIGAMSNEDDGGRVRAFSGANLAGTFLGEAPFADGGFGGLISTQLIGSVQFTCDFDGDRKCGVYDIQFGTTAAPGGPVPEPATWLLLLPAAGALLARAKLGPR